MLDSDDFQRASIKGTAVTFPNAAIAAERLMSLISLFEQELILKDEANYRDVQKRGYSIKSLHVQEDGRSTFMLTCRSSNKQETGYLYVPGTITLATLVTTTPQDAIQFEYPAGWSTDFEFSKQQMLNILSLVRQICRLNMPIVKGNNKKSNSVSMGNGFQFSSANFVGSSIQFDMKITRGKNLGKAFILSTDISRNGLGNIKIEPPNPVGYDMDGRAIPAKSTFTFPTLAEWARFMICGIGDVIGGSTPWIDIASMRQEGAQLRFRFLVPGTSAYLEMAGHYDVHGHFIIDDLPDQYKGPFSEGQDVCSIFVFLEGSHHYPGYETGKNEPWQSITIDAIPGKGGVQKITTTFPDGDSRLVYLDLASKLFFVRLENWKVSNAGYFSLSIALPLARAV